jgi:hypothetical protein
LEYWLPDEAYDPDGFRKKSWLRPAFDSGLFSRLWWFSVRGAFIPRDAVRQDEQLRIRFVVANKSRHEGTIYYIVKLRDVYKRDLVYSSDVSGRRHGNTACITAGEQHRIEHVIPWDELTRSLPTGHRDEVHLAVEIELWTPGRLKSEEMRVDDTQGWWPPRGMFQHVELMHNPSVVLRPPIASCFISYSWTGRRDLPANAYRCWVYRLADALSRYGLRPIIDYDFLAPTLVSREVIQRFLDDSDAILIIYSDEYLERIGNPTTGVGFEYGLIRSRVDLWAKTVPLRRGLRDREADVFTAESRFIDDLEGESLNAAAAILAEHVIGRVGSRP